MKTTLKIALAAAAVIAPTWVMASMSAGDVAGKSEAEIRTSLEAKGYTIKKFETEDDEIEVYAELDGKLYELEISTNSGKITEIELEDDEECGDD